MATERWTWSDQAHSRVMRVFEGMPIGLEWCSRLETAPTDPIVGKALCVCAAAAIAREVLATASPAVGERLRTNQVLEVLDRWIDDPIEERFEEISALIFDDGQSWPNDDPHGVGWWALRTSTSSVGNFEAGWALKTTCEAAISAGFNTETLREIVRRELLSRIGRGP